MNDELTIAQQGGLANDHNADLSVDDVRALLAGEITEHDINLRRIQAQIDAYEAQHLPILVKKYGWALPQALLRLYKAKRRMGLMDYYDDEFCRLNLEAMRTVLNTREHIGTPKERRQRLAKQNRGSGKSKNR